jgi:protein-tyrosine phosphatase
MVIVECMGDDVRWPHSRGVDGGADEIPLPNSPGRLWLCGKHAIGPDPEAALRHLQLTTVVCLTQRRELSDRFPDYVAWLDANVGERAIWFPIHDLSAPDLASMDPLFSQLTERLERGEGLLVHCAAGIGRSGTTAVALCMIYGMPRDEALRHVRAHRPMAGPEVGAQLSVINELAARLEPAN